MAVSTGGKLPRRLHPSDSSNLRNGSLGYTGAHLKAGRTGGVDALVAAVDSMADAGGPGAAGGAVDWPFRGDPDPPAGARSLGSRPAAAGAPGHFGCVAGHRGPRTAASRLGGPVGEDDGRGAQRGLCQGDGPGGQRAVCERRCKGAGGGTCRGRYRAGSGGIGANSAGAARRAQGLQPGRQPLGRREGHLHRRQPARLCLGGDRSRLGPGADGHFSGRHGHFRRGVDGGLGPAGAADGPLHLPAAASAAPRHPRADGLAGRQRQLAAAGLCASTRFSRP